MNTIITSREGFMGQNGGTRYQIRGNKKSPFTQPSILRANPKKKKATKKNDLLLSLTIMSGTRTAIICRGIPKSVSIIRFFFSSLPYHRKVIGTTHKPMYIVDKDTPTKELPEYLRLVSARRKDRLCHSKRLTYCWNRWRLEHYGVAIMEENASHPKIRFYQNKRDTKITYKKYSTGSAFVLYIPIREYHEVAFRFRMRYIFYLCEILGLRYVRYRYTTTSSTKTQIGGGGGQDGLEGNAKSESQHSEQHHDMIEQEYPERTSPYVTLSVEELLDKLYHDDAMLKSLRVGDDLEVRYLLNSRLHQQMEDCQFVLEEKLLTEQEYSIMVAFESMFSAMFRYKSLRSQTIQIHVRAYFYPVAQIMGFESMRQTSTCFSLIRKGQHNRLMDTFIEKHLINEGHRMEALRYMIFKLVEKEYREKLLDRLQTYQDLNDFLLDYLNSVPLASKIPLNDDGLFVLGQIWIMLYKEYKHTDLPEGHPDPCYNIRCKQPKCITCGQRVIFSYLIAVYNYTNPNYILSHEDDPELTKALKAVIRNIKFLPTFNKLQMVVHDRLREFSIQRQENDGE
jgi:hypothetical protein